MTDMTQEIVRFAPDIVRGALCGARWRFTMIDSQGGSRGPDLSDSGRRLTPSAITIRPCGAHAVEGRIALGSPVGRSLRGPVVGDAVVVPLPVGGGAPARRGARLMAPAAVDSALVAAFLGVLSASIVAVRYGRWPVAENVTRPWAPCGWRRALTVGEQEEARARAMGVARLTLGEEIWAAFARDGYVDLPSAAEPGTHYRLRPARRVEIWEGLPATDLQGCGGARAYLCVYPAYELPAVEFMAQLYLRLRDDEERALATGRLQSSDGRIPNVF